MATLVGSFLGGAIGTAIGYGIAYGGIWLHERIRDWLWRRRFDRHTAELKAQVALRRGY